MNEQAARGSSPPRGPFVVGALGLEDGVLASALDELPLWSAPFGLALLEVVDLRPGLVAVDVGCGTGFPLVELAQRLGPRALVHGIDPWRAGLERARQKLAACGLGNVVLHEARAERLPLADGTVDLVVSNNGFNNVADIEASIRECARVARPGAQMVFSCNLPGTMRELYSTYDEVLRGRGLEAARKALARHVLARRKPVAFTTDLLERSGFAVNRVLRRSFSMRFANAEAMLSHFFMRLAFVPGWLEILDPPLREPILADLGRRLDEHARAAGGLVLAVPFACYDCGRTRPAGTTL